MELSRHQVAVLCLSILVVALCGITYELIMGAVSSYLLGNSVFQFSIIIGLFMFAMGIGSFLSRYVTGHLIKTFVIVEILIALVGGISSLTLFIVFSSVPNVYHIAMYGMVITIGAMVGIEIPLLTRILATRKSIKDALSEAFSLDYIGALIGSLLFPLLLLPHLGLIRSSFAIGLFNISVAFLNAWVFRHYFKKPTRTLVLTGAIIVALIAAVIFGSYLTRYSERRLYQHDVLFKQQSIYQQFVFTKSAQNQEHRLYIDGHIQFAENDEHRYHEALVHPVMQQNQNAQEILILGGGDGMGAREIFKWPNIQSIDLVDIDPAITRICRDTPTIAKINNNALSDPRLTIINTDAFQFVRDTKKRYDRIIIDLPDPHNEVLNKLYSREFYRLLKRVLNPGGGLVSQCSSPFVTRRVYWCIARSMEEAGFNIVSYHTPLPSFGIWGFHMAFPKGTTIDLTRPLPKNLQYIDEDTLASITNFPPDISRIDTPVNSMLEPILYQIYNQETGH